MWNRVLSCLFAAVVGFGAPQAMAADTTSSLLNLLIMGSGLHNNDWGTQTNTNLQKIESAIAGIGSYSVSGGTLTLSDAQALPAALAFTGTLSSNQTVILPAHSRIWIVFNSTSGAYTLTLQAAGAGTTINVAQGTNRIFISDGTNVYDASPPVIDAVPVGAMLHYAGTTAPANYHLCDAAAVSRATYSTLFSALGTTYGGGDGSTTFNLPDSKGRVLAAPDGGAGRLTNFSAVLGAAGGEQNHTLVIAEMPSHNHTITDLGHSHTDSGHNHPTLTPGVQILGTGGSGYGFSVGGLFSFQTPTTGVGFAQISTSTTGITINNKGGDVAHNVVQPTLVVNCIIRVQ